MATKGWKERCSMTNNMLDHEAARAARKVILAQSATELISKAKLFPDGGIGHKRAVERLEEMPTGCRMTYIRALKGKSMAAAIKAQCMECVGWIRDEVRQCSALACPLYPYRPYKKRTE